MIFLSVLIYAVIVSLHEGWAISRHSRRFVKHNNIPTKLLFGIMFLLCALRGSSVGKDTENYLNGYNNGFTERIEYGFQFLISACKMCGLDFQLFVALFALLSIYPLYIVFRKESVNVAFSLLIFFSFSNYFYPETFNTIRATTAVAFFLLSLLSYHQNQFKKYVLFSIVAILFHNSAIVAVLLSRIVFMIEKISLKSTFELVVFSFILGISFKLEFSEQLDSLSSWMGQFSGETSGYYARHLSFVEESNYNLIGTLSSILPFSILSLLCYNEENGGNIYYKLFIIGVVLSNIFVSVTLSYRITMYFTVFICIILPNTLSKVCGLKYKACIVMTILMLFWFLYRLFIIKDSLAGINPYTFCFE